MDRYRYVTAVVITGGLALAPPAAWSAVPAAPQYDAAQEYRLGQAAFNVGDFASAKTAFDHIVAVAPKDANAHYLAGAARVRLGDHKGATALLERAVKLDKGMTSAWSALGVAYARSGNKGKAKTTIATLQARAAVCGKCSDASALRSAIDAIAAALALER